MYLGYIKLKGERDSIKISFEKELNLSPQNKFIVVFKEGKEKRWLLVNVDYIVCLEYEEI